MRNFSADADPADLLIYSWLRSRIPIAYGGVCGRLLEKLGVVVRRMMTIVLTSAEADAMQLLHGIVAQLLMLLGDACSLPLLSGSKLEIEAIVSFSTSSPQEMLDSLIS